MIKPRCTHHSGLEPESWIAMPITVGVLLALLLIMKGLEMALGIRFTY